MDNLRGRTIAITGAARGIGHATAKALLNRGARVVIGDRDVAVLESTFTDTELIAGTKNTGAQKPVQPEDIAGAIVKSLDKPKTHVSVPAPLRFIGAVTSMLGPRGRRWLSKQMGNDHVFLDFDKTARSTYEGPAQAAKGMLEKTAG